MIAILEQNLLLTKAEMTLDEVVDMEKLRTIRDNFEVLYSAGKLGRFIDVKKGGYKAITDMKTIRTIINDYYTTKIKSTKMNYKYANGKKSGRMFSTCHSLQSISRKIRGCISRGIYKDVDMVNAHIVILKHFCSSEGILTPNLDRYINDREPLLAELMSDLGIDRDTAKTIPLSVINGGSGVVCVDNIDIKYEIGHEPEWLSGIKTEMREAFNIYKVTPTGRKVYERIKKAKDWNIEGSTMNVMFCEEENKLLVCLYKYLQSIGITLGAFVFDGAMINISSLRGKDINELQAELEAEMSNKLGYTTMKLAFKDFEDIDLTGLVKKDDCDMSERGLADVILKSVDYKYHKPKKCFYMFDTQSRLWVGHDGFSIFWDLIDEILPPYITANSVPDSDELKSALSIIKSASKVGNIVKFIQNTIKAKDSSEFINNTFDLSKGLIPLADGLMVDIKTGIVRERIKEDYFTKTTQSNVLDEYDEEFYRGYIKEILSTDNEVYINYLLETVGYMMSGENNMKKFFVMIGVKDTGKSLFVALLQKMMGFLGGMANDKVFKQKTQSCHDTETFSLDGKRFACVSELGENEKFNEEQIKKISGGDSLNIRRAGSRENEEVKFDCVLILATNEVPTFHEQAFAGRMRVLNFNKVFENNPARRDEILANSDVFFSMCIKAGKRYYDNGMNIVDCEEVVVASKRLVTEKNPVTQWWSNQTDFEFTTDVNKRIKKVEIWNSFSGEMGRSVLGRNKFYAMFMDIYKTELLRTDYRDGKEWNGLQRAQNMREDCEEQCGLPDF